MIFTLPDRQRPLLALCSCFGAKGFRLLRVAFSVETHCHITSSAARPIKNTAPTTAGPLRVTPLSSWKPCSNKSRRTSSQTPRLTFWSCAVSVGRSSSAQPAETWFSTATPSKPRTAARTAKHCGHCDPLRAKGCWRARPRPPTQARRSLLSPPNSRPVTAVRTVVGVPGVGHWGHFRRLGQR